MIVNYYLLLTTNQTTQSIGQFLPATMSWGLPLIPQATQSLKVLNQGSLVIDLTAKGNVVWRGVAQAEIKIGSDLKKREAKLREGVRDMLEALSAQAAVMAIARLADPDRDPAVPGARDRARRRT